MFFNCHTYFSFKYSTLSVNDLFEEAIRNGVHKLVLTDINNTCAYIELLRVCRERRKDYKLDVGLGIEFRNSSEELCFIALARNDDGFYEVNRFLSNCNNNNVDIPYKAPEFSNVNIVYPFYRMKGVNPEVLREFEYVGIREHELNSLHRSPYLSYSHKLVAWSPVTFGDQVSFNTHKLLRAVSYNTLLSKITPENLANRNEVMHPPQFMIKMYQNYPFLIENAMRLTDDTGTELKLGSDKNKQTITGSFSLDCELLEEKAKRGFENRYGTTTPFLKERFDREMKIIRERKFVSYYLIADEIVQFARHNNYGYVGRGSGANSMIAYCLGITNVDPIELDLYFERFLNPERSSPPDFDMDFSWKERDEVTKFIFRRFEKEHVALLGTHTTFQSRSVIRELAKVFGLPKEEIDTLVEKNYALYGRDKITNTILRYARRIKDMPSNISIHAGGVLITEEPIYQYTATDLPPKDFPVAHFEMHNAEDMGIYKFDVLSQRGLGHIKDTCQIVKENRGKSIDINDFRKFKKDVRIRELLRKGHTIGCFYVESPAMRGLLGKLGCEDYITLVAASSIIRPGVARSGMMRAYIERHHAVQNGNTYESIHPKMDKLMAETYGVMVYQEDVIKVAHHFAGLTLSEADILRRGMSGKFRSRSEFKRVEKKFFENCNKMDIPDKVSQRVWFEIESFSGYSFSKGHSASYAVESYQSLYLKAHYPLEFMVGVINNFGGFYKTEFYFHEARMSGAKIEAPCVNRSEYLTSIKEKTITIGLIHLKSLETSFAQSLVKERGINGNFKSLDNFIRRLKVSLEQLYILIRAGAFRFTGIKKADLMWSSMLYFKKSGKSEHFVGLFDEKEESCALPSFTRESYEDALDELELLGFPLSDPFSLLREQRRDSALAEDLLSYVGKEVAITGYLITIKNTSTKNKHLMHFGTFYDRRGKVFDTVHFPQTAQSFPFRGRGFYHIRGEVVTDFGLPSIEVNFMEKLAIHGRVGPKVML